MSDTEPSERADRAAPEETPMGEALLYWQERAQAAEDRTARLEAALREADEVFDLMDYQGARARAITAPEDDEVGRLCERHGYGAVMDSAARLWWHLDGGRGGSFIVGSAACLVEKAAKAVKAALATAQGDPS